jgi:DNA-binding transcriptional regulator YiaG
MPGATPQLESSRAELAKFCAYVEACPADCRELMATRNRQELTVMVRAHSSLISEACLEAWEQHKLRILGGG